MRCFRTHDLRQVEDLTGVWEFAFLGQVDAEAVDPASIRFDDLMTVPGCFDATPAYAGQRGLAAYRRKVTLLDGAPHRLILDGVHHWCRAFLGGRCLGDHGHGFTRFHFDITGQAAGAADLVVLVDNRIDPQRSPLHLDYYDWYHFGGIARGAELQRLGSLWIDQVTVATEDLARRRIRVRIDWNATGAPGPIPLVIACDSRVVLRETVELPRGPGRIERLIKLGPEAQLWSPAEPRLHLLHVQLGSDDQRERFGLRQVRVDGQRILLNGAPLRLLGFCRHESHPQFGHAIPEQLMLADLQLLKDMGCNFIRGSHYPQDRRFLDLCDELGFCVWCEATGWGNTVAQLSDPSFVRAQLQCVDEMVADAVNHPSIILWGILNECEAFKPESRATLEKLFARLRQLDPTRPVTYASCNWPVDICWDLVDVLSVNTYPGWYHGEIESIPESLDKIVAHLEAQNQGGKPLILSEVGAAAVYGFRDAHEARWSEQYQAKLLDAVIRHLFVEGERWCGLSIWQFCDIRTSESLVRAMVRARCFNNKGVLDEYRRPKMAYEAVKRRFKQIAEGSASGA